MSRRSRRKSQRARREASDFATGGAWPDNVLQTLIGPSHLSYPSSPLGDLASGLFSAPLTDLEDRRAFYPGDLPTNWAPARTVGGTAARLRVVPGARPRSLPTTQARTLWPSAAIGFQNPPSVLICVRRQRRREVLHAIGAAGTRVRRPTRNEYSSISCRRRK